MRMRTKTDMRRWLRSYRTDFDVPFAGLVLAKGEWFLGRASVDDYEITRLWQKQKKPRAGQCFYNAQQFCIACGIYRYFEGYFLIGGTPMDHAWVVMDDGKVIDFTLEAVLRKVKRTKKGAYDDRPPLYLGVEVPVPFLQACVLETDNGEPLAEMVTVHAAAWTGSKDGEALV